MVSRSPSDPFPPMAIPFARHFFVFVSFMRLSSMCWCAGAAEARPPALPPADGPVRVPGRHDPLGPVPAEGVQGRADALRPPQPFPR